MIERAMLYVLVDGEPVGVQDVLLWARWWRDARLGGEHIVEHTKVDDVLVSTVFLATDYNWTGDGPPILWETMVFGGDMDGECFRHTSLEQAEAFHAELVGRLVG